MSIGKEDDGGSIKICFHCIFKEFLYSTFVSILSETPSECGSVNCVNEIILRKSCSAREKG